MNNPKKHQDDDPSNEKTVSKFGQTPSYYINSSPDNIFRINLAEPEHTSSIVTVEPHRKQNKVIGKKRKRNEEVEQNLCLNKKYLSRNEFKNTINEFEQEFKQIGLTIETPKDKKTTVNLGLLHFSQNIFDFVKLDSNKLNKTLENNLGRDGISETGIKYILNKLRNTKSMRLADTREMINRFNNIDFSNSHIFDICTKIVNYYDNKLNECDYEFEGINWKDINKNKTSEKISSYRNLIINKTKKLSSVERLYDRVVSRSLIYLLNKKGRFDNELKEALCKTNLVLDKKYIPALPLKYLNQIESLFDGNKCENIFKYVLSLIQYINNKNEIPEDLLYILFDEEEIVKKSPRKPKQEEQTNIIKNEAIIIPAEVPKSEKSTSAKNIIKIDTSAFLDNKEIEKRIQEEKKKLFIPSDCGNNVLFNVNVNLNVNLKVNVTNSETGTKSTIIKIDYDSINKHIHNQQLIDDGLTITASDKTISVCSRKKKNKIFVVSKVKREEFQLMPIKNINFEIRPTFKKNKKYNTSAIINN
jgi:hypothetical protein